MRRKLGREIALISLPLLIIGAAAWLLAGNGRALLPARFDNGPARLGFSAFERVELEPFDVYQKFDWGTKATVSEIGKFDVPASWKGVGGTGIRIPNLRLVYRVGQKWRAITPPKKTRWYMTTRNLDGVLSIKVDLQGVPFEAEEVRLRGAFQSGVIFRGTLPAGWNSPPNIKNYGPRHEYEILSPDFDILVKSPGQPLPSPRVAPVPDLEFVAAGWYYKPSIYYLLVRLRTRDGQKRKWNNLQVLSYSLRDSAGREIVFVNKKGTPQRESDWVYIYRNNYPELPEDEAIFDLIFGNSEPRGGWENVKGPMTLEALVSDGKSWPLRVRATLQQQPGDYKTLAQIPALTN